MVFDYFAFAENDELTGVKVTDALEFTEFASRDTDKETSFNGFYGRSTSYSAEVTPDKLGLKLKARTKTVWDLYSRGISYIRSIMKHTSDKAVLDKYLQEIISTYYRNGLAVFVESFEVASPSYHIVVVTLHSIADSW